MAGRSYPFFPRQTLLQDGTDPTTYLSNTFDLQSENSIMIEMRPFAVTGTTPSIAIGFQTTNDLSANDDEWYEDLTFTAVTSGGGVATRVNIPSGGAPLGKFGRVKVVMTGDGAAITFEVLGLARST